jgi:hypothetical protein
VARQDLESPLFPWLAGPTIFTEKMPAALGLLLKQSAAEQTYAAGHTSP